MENVSDRCVRDKIFTPIRAEETNCNPAKSKKTILDRTPTRAEIVHLLQNRFICRIKTQLPQNKTNSPLHLTNFIVIQDPLLYHVFLHQNLQLLLLLLHLLHLFHGELCVVRMLSHFLQILKLNRLDPLQFAFDRILRTFRLPLQALFPSDPVSFQVRPQRRI